MNIKRCFDQLNQTICKCLIFGMLVSLTLVTSFFETSKLWACIIYALEGLECQG
jgi:hypothetical protein